jgi:hypothetical protein
MDKKESLAQSLMAFFAASAAILLVIVVFFTSLYLLFTWADAHLVHHQVKMPLALLLGLFL